MALRIVNNIAAMTTQRWLGVSDAGMKKSLERLSSGYRINRAADDAAGLAISQSFRADIASFKVASRNTSEASSLLQVAEGAMDQIGNMLTRLKELATQAASANVGDTDREKINAEKTQLLTEMNRIANSTEYAGTKLIDGTFGTLSALWGNDAADNSYTIDTVNGLNYKYVDETTDTETVNFTLDTAKTLTAADTYTLATTSSAGTMTATATASSEVFYGTLSGTTLTFDTIGVTITGDSNLTEANVADDSFIISDAGYSSMSLTSSVATGTWTMTSAAANSITLTNSRTSDAQTVTTVSASAQTVDFDQLGIKLTLDSGYSDNDFDDWAFVVSTSGSADFQIGSANTSNDQISISVGDATTGTSGLGVSGIDLSSASGAQTALTTIDSAIDSLSTLRGEIGGYMNRLGYAAANLASTIENVQAAESVIRDVDMASEMTDFTKNQILLQAGTAMLAQANMAPQQVLALFG